MPPPSPPSPASEADTGVSSPAWPPDPAGIADLPPLAFAAPASPPELVSPASLCPPPLPAAAQVRVSMQDLKLDEQAVSLVEQAAIAPRSSQYFEFISFDLVGNVLGLRRAKCLSLSSEPPSELLTFGSTRAPRVFQAREGELRRPCASTGSFRGL